jgi:hypothetical protein
MNQEDDYGTDAREEVFKALRKELEHTPLLMLLPQRLLSTAPARPFRTAAQQRLIQVVRDFCDHSNSICENCKLPTLIRNKAI